MSQKIRLTVLVSLAMVLLFAAPMMASAVSEWSPGVAYKVGDQVMYSGTLYECQQAHTSLTGWEPPNVPALWKALGSAPKTPTPTATQVVNATSTPAPSATSGGNCIYPGWVRGNVYNTDNRVSWNGKAWRAKWWSQNEEPGTTGTWGVWEDLGSCGTSGATNTPTSLPPTATASATSGPSQTPIAGTIPTHVFAAYADISFTSIQAAQAATGQKYYAIAFVLGKNHTCEPAWDGTHPMSENFYASQIAAIRAAGGDVIAVFGGANGSELGSVCGSVSSLQAAYQAVINQYQIKWIDLNIEGGLIADETSIDRRNKAVKALQDANPGLRVSYTMPVMQSGLLQTALDLLGNAKTNNVRVDYVNIMTMNYGPAGIDMGQATISSAINTRNQLVSMGLSTTKIGLTPMNGQNNTYGEIFTLADADEVVAFAKANSYVGWLSFWSLGRDNGSCAGQTSASASCSGIAQSEYAFTAKFQQFP